MALFRTKEARNNLQDWLNQNHGNGSDNYSAAISSALASAASRQPAASRYNTGSDPNIQANRTNYRLMAQAAADQAAAGTKALSGGYDAGYADSAAAQGYQTLMEGQHDAEAQLRQLALQGLTAQDSQSDALVSALLGAQQLETSANQMAQDRYQAQRDFLTNEVTQAQTEQDNFWDKVWNSLVWAGNVALQTYDNYKGFSQQQWENDFAQRQWEAQLAQQALENERYNTEYADTRADTAWSHGITEQELALEQLASQDDHAAAQLALEKTRQDMQLAAQAAARSASSGRSGGRYSSGRTLSASDLDKLVSGYMEAKAVGDTESMGIYASALAAGGYDVAGGATTTKTSGSGTAAQRSGTSSTGSGNTILAGGIPVPIGMGYQDDALLSALSGLDSNNGMAMNNMSDSDMIRYLISLGFSDTQIQNIMNGMG